VHAWGLIAPGVPQDWFWTRKDVLLEGSKALFKRQRPWNSIEEWQESMKQATCVRPLLVSSL
jgi:hypothetical protein